MANELIGYGATLAYSDTAGGTYTSVAGILELEPAGFAVSKVKKTAHDSPSYAEEYQPGMIDAGEISFKAHFKKATVGTAIFTLFTGRTLKYWRVTFALASGESTASKFVCQGFLSSYKPMMPLEDNLIVDLKITLTGLPVFTEGS